MDSVRERRARQAKRGAGLVRQAHRLHAEVLADAQDQSEDARVDVEMLVRVDVIERQARGLEGAELGPDLALELRACARQQEVAHAVEEQPVAKAAVRVHQRRNVCRRQQRRAIGQHQVQPHAQPRQLARAPHRVRGGRGAHHEACRLQGTGAARVLDRLVHGLVQAEIIGGQNQKAFRPHAREESERTRPPRASVA